MSSRQTISNIHNTTQMSSARATVREFDDEHLMQQIKYADVMHSETPSDFERWQMVGLTAVPLKQDEEQKGQESKEASSETKSEQGDWNHNQPKGDAAEAMMLYVGGSRSHPVGIVDDRRVRPYGMKPGEGAHYAPDGSEQMSFVNEKGYYVVSLDGPSHGSKETKTRMASLRHVKKKMQTHKIEKAQQGQGQQAQQQQKEQYKHEGESVNTEVRCTAKAIEFRAGDKVFGSFTVDGEKWNFNGKTAEHDFSGDFTRKADNILDRPQSKYELEEGADSFVEGQAADLSGKVKIKKFSEDTADPGSVARMSELEQRIVELERRIAALEI